MSALDLESPAHVGIAAGKRKLGEVSQQVWSASLYLLRALKDSQLLLSTTKHFLDHQPSKLIFINGQACLASFVRAKRTMSITNRTFKDKNKTLNPELGMEAGSKIKDFLIGCLE